MADENVMKWLREGMSPMQARSNVSDGSSLSLRGGKQMLQADSGSAMSTESTRQPLGELQVLGKSEHDWPPTDDTSEILISANSFAWVCSFRQSGRVKSTHQLLLTRRTLSSSIRGQQQEVSASPSPLKQPPRPQP